MKILAIDTSSQSAGCALTEDDFILGEFFTNIKLTHSQTIMPMVQSLLEQTRISLGEVDLFAVTHGPGSFTGLRIGLSAVKGMAHALGKHCIGISTLEALAIPFSGQSCVVAPVLDARCSQVYTALFRWSGNTFTRLEEDSALTIQQLEDRLKNVENSVFLVGDGAKMCYTILNEQNPALLTPSPALLYVRASSVALAAGRLFAAGGGISPGALAPAYLRLPQAERELLARQSN